MFAASRIYSFDIETNTGFDEALGRNVNGLDPREARITEIAISTVRGDEVFTDTDEAKLIGDFDYYVQNLPPGLLTTWNGHFFDLPFIWSRWHGVDGAGVPFVGQDEAPRWRTGSELGMHPILQPGLTPKYDFLPGYTAALSCNWASDSWLRLDRHTHLDISDAYKGFAAEHGIKHRLKPVCIAKGYEMIEVDRANMHLLTPAERAAYACSDTRGTRQLAIDLLGAP